MKFDRKLRVMVSTMHSCDARVEPMVQVHVEDDASSQTLAERLGKRMENISVPLGRPPLDVDRNDGEAWARARAAEVQPVSDGWESGYDAVSLRNTNSGWVAIYRRWV